MYYLRRVFNCRGERNFGIIKIEDANYTVPGNSRTLGGSLRGTISRTKWRRPGRKEKRQRNVPRFSRLAEARFDPLNTNEMQNRLFGLRRPFSLNNSLPDINSWIVPERWREKISHRYSNARKLRKVCEGFIYWSLYLSISLCKYAWIHVSCTNKII